MSPVRHVRGFDITVADDGHERSPGICVVILVIHEAIVVDVHAVDNLEIPAARKQNVFVRLEVQIAICGVDWLCSRASRVGRNLKTTSRKTSAPMRPIAQAKLAYSSVLPREPKSGESVELKGLLVSRYEPWILLFLPKKTDGAPSTEKRIQHNCLIITTTAFEFTSRGGANTPILP